MVIPTLQQLAPLGFDLQTQVRRKKSCYNSQKHSEVKTEFLQPNSESKQLITTGLVQGATTPLSSIKFVHEQYYAPDRIVCRHNQIHPHNFS